MSNAFVDSVLSAENLPSLPNVAIEVLALSRKPDATADDLAAIVQNDPAISARLLQIVNSALYGLPRKIGSVRQAISMLGVRSVTVTVLTCILVDSIKGQAAGEMSLEAYWRKSLGSAAAARMLGRHSCESLAEEAFVVGLLSDIGIMAAWRSAPQEYGAVFQRAESERIPLHELEQEVFGVDHAVLSASLLRRWRLPDNLASAVEGHHGRQVSGVDRETAKLVQVAYHAANISSLFCGEACPSKLNKIRDECLAGLGVDSSALENVLVSLSPSVQETANALSVEIGATVNYDQLKADAAVRLAGLSIEAEAERAKYAEREMVAQSHVDQLRKENLAILEVASTDKLTNLSNRAAFDQAMEQMLNQARISASSLAVIFIDIDFFKHFNDDHGHHVGDEALKVVAHALRSSLGGLGVVARYGGEEFVAIIAGASEPECRNCAEGARKAVEQAKVHAADQALSVTISVGIAFAIAWPEATTPDQIIKLADEQLYKAKRAGRNRVEAAVFVEALPSRKSDRKPAAAA